MSYIFDSSSIFRAIMDDRVESLPGSYTLELARFELGNILWKEHSIHAALTQEELRKIAKVVKDVLDLMEPVSIKCREEQILETAKDLKMTFYDASYVYYAKEKQVPLVTEDSSIIDKAKQHIETLKLDQLH